MYNAQSYNCAHYVAERLNLEVEHMDVYSRRFIKYMRENFTRIDEPVDGCLVLMVYLNGDYHIGIYEDYMITHNYKSSNAKYGDICRDTLLTMNLQCKEVKFYDKS